MFNSRYWKCTPFWRPNAYRIMDVSFCGGGPGRVTTPDMYDRITVQCDDAIRAWWNCGQNQRKCCKSKVKVILTDSQSASLSWCQATIRVSGQFFFALEFCYLKVCYFVTSSLTRGRVCSLLLLLGLASAVPLGSASRGTQDHILLSQFFETPQTWRTRSPYLYSPGTGWPSYTPGHWVPFPSPLMTCRGTVEVL
jgi:hypothetical protein